MAIIVVVVEGRWWAVVLFVVLLSSVVELGVFCSRAKWLTDGSVDVCWLLAVVVVV